MRSDDTGADGRLEGLTHEAPWDGRMRAPGQGAHQRSPAMGDAAATPWLTDQPPLHRWAAPETSTRQTGFRGGAVTDHEWPEANPDLDSPEALMPSTLSFSPEEEQELAKGLLLVVLR